MTICFLEPKYQNITRNKKKDYAHIPALMHVVNGSEWGPKSSVTAPLRASVVFEGHTSLPNESYTDDAGSVPALDGSLNRF